MYYLENICFICLSDKKPLKAVFHEETENEIIAQMKYAIPELFDLDSKIPLNICCSCHKELALHTMTDLLENYNRFKRYIETVQGTSYTKDKKCSELQIRVINCDFDRIKEECEDFCSESKICELPNVILHREDIKIEPKSIVSEESMPQLDNQLNIKKELEEEQQQEKEDTLLDDQEVKTDDLGGSHLKPEERPKCSICSSEFCTFRLLNSHLEFNPQSFEFKCTIGTDNFSTDTGLINQTDDEDNLINFFVSNSKPEYKCLACSEVFTCHVTMKEHKKTHIKIWRKEARVIIAKAEKLKAKKFRWALKKQKIEALMIKNKCYICNRILLSYKSLQKHGRKHFREIGYIACRFCYQLFTNFTALNLHLKSHLGVKDYECPICHKRFIKNHLLVNHITYHLRPQKYKCTICYEIIDKKNLDIHMESHPGRDSFNRGFNCHFCDRKNMTQYTLIEHLKHHERTAENKTEQEEKNKCFVCCQIFPDEPALHSHYITHFVSKNSTSVN